MGFRFRALALLCVAISMATVPIKAFADVTAIQSITVPLTATNFGVNGAPNDPLVFNQFDPTLGTLQQVNVTMQYDFNQQISMTFANPATITVTAGNNLIALERPDTTSIFSATPPTFSETVTYGFAPGETTFPHTLNFGPQNNHVSLSPVALTSGSDLAAFTGPGTIALPLIASAVSSFSSTSGNGTGSSTTMAGATVTVQYVYSPTNAVPEPSSMILLGLGGGGLMWGRRLRRRLAQV